MNDELFYKIESFFSPLEKDSLSKDVINLCFSASEITHYFRMLCDSVLHANVMSKTEIEKGLRSFVINHVLDSIMIDLCIDTWDNAALIDIGSGAGIPGIPIYIIIKGLKEVLLLEARQKKVEFLTKTVNNIGLTNIKIACERAEIVGKDKNYREIYDISTIRAVGSIEESLELSLPFIKVGGLSVLYRGQLSTSDIEFSTGIAEKFGGKLENIVNYRLCGSENPRNLMVFRKERPTDSKFPRRSGVPRKHSKRILHTKPF